MRNTRLDNVICFVGRKNSGKTMLVEQVIDELTQQGIVVSSLKHYRDDDFEIDYPGQDSHRHHMAGTLATAIASPNRRAIIEKVGDPWKKASSKTDEWNDIDLTNVDELLKISTGGTETASLEVAQECRETIGLLPASNVVIVEGCQQAGLPCIELFRQDNPYDAAAAGRFCERARDLAYNDHALPNAVVTDIPEVTTAALLASVPCFEFREIAQIARWVNENYAKPLLSLAIQCGGETRPTKKLKALELFHGRPLIEHLIGRLAPLASDLIITANEIEELTYLQLRYPGVRLVPNKHKKREALPGFITALETAYYPTVAVVACDLVNVSTDLIEHEAETLETTKRTSLYLPPDAIVPMTPEGPEPLCAVYDKERCLEAALDCWNRRRVRMKDVLDMLNVQFIDSVDNPLCPEGCFLNDAGEQLLTR